MPAIHHTHLPGCYEACKHDVSCVGVCVSCEGSRGPFRHFECGLSIQSGRGSSFVDEAECCFEHAGSRSCFGGILGESRHSGTFAVLELC